MVKYPTQVPNFGKISPPRDFRPPAGGAENPPPGGSPGTPQKWPFFDPPRTPLFDPHFGPKIDPENGPSINDLSRHVINANDLGHLDSVGYQLV